MKTQAEIDGVAASIRDAGLPDAYNRLVGLTPAALEANEQRRAASTAHANNPFAEESMRKIGVKEQQLRDRRSGKTQPAGLPAQPKETAMQTITTNGAATPTTAGNGATPHPANPPAAKPTETPDKAPAKGPGAKPAAAPGKPGKAAQATAGKAGSKAQPAPSKAAKGAAATAAPKGAKGAGKGQETPAKGATPPAAKPAKEDSHKGAFRPEVAKPLIALVEKKGGTTVGAMIKAARWGSCANPIRRVNRFISTVLKGDLKMKVKIDGDGEDAKVTVAA